MTTLQYSENYLVTTTYPGFSGVTKLKLNYFNQVVEFFCFYSRQSGAKK